MNCVSAWATTGGYSQTASKSRTLTLLLDRGEQAQGPRWQAASERFQDLHQVLARIPDPALVLLGASGCGKSTLLRHFELDCARAVLEGNPRDLSQAPLTFFIQLNSYKPQKGCSILS